MAGDEYVPTAMIGWSGVLLRRVRDGRRQVIPVDALLAHLDAWERRST
ncbi:MAG: hypothetical protein LC753_03560 [Acidobacteria bacterium]|nr:hypothetical protein [Acidobacteriota bacterium]MCA1649376.1 hypothetical protein [Acidobacteriota bacterium]